MRAWSSRNTPHGPSGQSSIVLAAIVVAGIVAFSGPGIVARQQRASAAEISQHIDRQWFLNSLIKDYLEHLRDAGAMPDGFFQINLDRQWKEPPGGTREATTTSQGRQIYSMAIGYEYSHDQKFLTALDRAIGFLSAKMHDDKYGGYFERVSQDGTVLNDGKQSYGMSFIVFGLAHAARVTKNPAYAALALKALAELKPMQRDGLFYVGGMNREFTSVGGRGGGRAAAPAASPDGTAGRAGAGTTGAGAAANAPAGDAPGAEAAGGGHSFNQHLFEAMLAVYDATGSRDVFNQMAATLETMASHFDDQYGYMPESFDANWKKTGGDRLNVGHLYEWAWLYSRAVEEGVPNGAKYIAMGNRMIDLGNKVGYNKPDGGIWQGADVNGNVTTRSMIWWAEAEHLRATAHYAIRHGRSDLWPYFDQSLKFVKANFIDPQYGGWYYGWAPDVSRDQMQLGFTKMKVDGASAATGKAGYHDTAMYHNMLRITAAN